MTKVRTILVASALMILALAGCRSAQTTSAILYIEQLQYDKAVKVLHEALEYNPEEADAFYYLGEAHSKLAEQAVQDNKYLEAKKNYEMAYGYYLRARELRPREFGESVAEALLHNYTLRSNDARRELGGDYYEAAEGYYRLAYAALPDSISPIKNIARMKIKQAAEKNNDPELLGEALTLLEQVLEARPEAYDLQADKANVLGRLGRNDEANAIYDKLLADHPDDTALIIDMANLAAQDAKLERAADLYVRLIKLVEEDGNPENDGDLKTWMVQAADWYSIRTIHRYDDAIDLYKRALQLELTPEEKTMSGRLLAHYFYGSMLKRDAENEADPVTKADLQARALAQFREGVDVGNALIEAYFNNVEGYQFLALCQKEMGDEKGYEANINRWIELQNQGMTP